MRHKVQITVETEKRTLFGGRKKVQEKKTAWVDDKTYRQIKKEWADHPYSIEEMMFYDDLFGDD